MKDLYVDGFIEKDAYGTDHARLQAELNALVRASTEQKTIPPVMERIMNDDDFIDTYLALPRELKRELWQSLIQHIELGRRPEERGKAYKDIRIYFY